MAYNPSTTQSFYQNSLQPNNFIITGNNTFSPYGSINALASFTVPENVSFSYFRALAAIRVNPVAFPSSLTTTTWATTYAHAQTGYVVIYSQGTGTNSSIMQSVYSASISYSYQLEGANAATNLSIHTQTIRVSYPLIGGGTTTFSGTQSTSAPYVFLNSLTATSLNQWGNNTVQFDINMTGFLAKSNTYFIGLNSQTATTGGSLATSMGVSLVNAIYSMNDFRPLGAFTSSGSTRSFGFGCGIFSNSVAGTASTIAFSALLGGNQAQTPMFQLRLNSV